MVLWVTSSVFIIVAFSASATAAEAKALDDTDDRDAQEKGHQTSNLGHELET